MKAIKKMYKDMYWGQIFNRKTTWEVKKIAIQSLWFMRGDRLTGSDESSESEFTFN
jgi:hypothetical protein